MLIRSLKLFWPNYMTLLLETKEIFIKNLSGRSIRLLKFNSSKISAKIFKFRSWPPWQFTLVLSKKYGKLDLCKVLIKEHIAEWTFLCYE